MDGTEEADLWGTPAQQQPWVSPRYPRNHQLAPIQSLTTIPAHPSLHRGQPVLPRSHPSQGEINRVTAPSRHTSLPAAIAQPPPRQAALVAKERAKAQALAAAELGPSQESSSPLTAREDTEPSEGEVGPSPSRNRLKQTTSNANPPARGTIPSPLRTPSPDLPDIAEETTTFNTAQAASEVIAYKCVRDGGIPVIKKTQTKWTLTCSGAQCPWEVVVRKINRGQLPPKWLGDTINANHDHETKIRGPPTITTKETTAVPSSKSASHIPSLTLRSSIRATEAKVPKEGKIQATSAQPQSGKGRHERRPLAPNPRAQNQRTDDHSDDDDEGHGGVFYPHLDAVTHASNTLAHSCGPALTTPHHPVSGRLAPLTHTQSNRLATPAPAHLPEPSTGPACFGSTLPSASSFSTDFMRGIDFGRGMEIGARLGQGSAQGDAIVKNEPSHRVKEAKYYPQAHDPRTMQRHCSPANYARSFRRPRGRSFSPSLSPPPSYYERQRSVHRQQRERTHDHRREDYSRREHRDDRGRAEAYRTDKRATRPAPDTWYAEQHSQASSHRKRRRSSSFDEGYYDEPRPRSSQPRGHPSSQSYWEDERLRRDGCYRGRLGETSSALSTQ